VWNIIEFLKVGRYPDLNEYELEDSGKMESRSGPLTYSRKVKGINSKGFRRWYITVIITGFLEFVHRLIF
jgi:hypothetical protein